MKNPSKEEKENFIWASYNGKYPPSTINVGKWLIFVSIDEIDKIWKKVKEALKEGRLGDTAKVGTKLQRESYNSNEHVICVYTYDYKDKKDVMRIRQELRELGITKKIPYKSDTDTLKGKYKYKGDKNISLYY